MEHFSIKPSVFGASPLFLPCLTGPDHEPEKNCTQSASATTIELVVSTTKAFLLSLAAEVGFQAKGIICTEAFLFQLLGSVPEGRSETGKNARLLGRLGSGCFPGW